MKKFLIATNVLTLIVLYMSSFTSGSTPRQSTTDPTPCSSCIDLSNPINGISVFTAQGMANTYKTNQWATLNLKTREFQDTRSVWFSLDRLRSFVGEIENTMCANKDKCHIQDFKLGVRIYFGCYPNFENMPAEIKSRNDYADVKDSYTKHLTMFMVPTYHNGDHEVDFDPRHLGSNLCKPTPLSELLKKKFDMNITTKADMSTNVKGLVIADPTTGQKTTNPTTQSAPTSFIAQQPPLNSNNSLILSACEKQIFYSERKNTTLMRFQGDGLMNHGNDIPPDASTGTAF